MSYPPLTKEERKDIMQTTAKIFVIGVLAALLGGFLGGNVIHELMNWAIFRQYGISSTPTFFGYLYGNDCPYNCNMSNPRWYVATAWTTQNAIQETALRYTNPSRFNMMYNELVLNESAPSQSLEMVGTSMALCCLATMSYVKWKIKKEMIIWNSQTN